MQSSSEALLPLMLPLRLLLDLTWNSSESRGSGVSCRAAGKSA